MFVAKTDPNAAAWAAYYQQQQYFQQPGGGAASGQQPGTPGQPEANSGSVPVNPQTGQPDYTAQWIQYYRSIGAMKDAEALEQQLKVTKVRLSVFSGLPSSVADRFFFA